MKIKSLKLQNFGNLSEANLEFDKGFTLISGKIGQGKSTIFEAIDYAIRKNTRPLPNMIKRGHSALDLSIELEHNGKTFKIEDQLRKKIGNIAHTKDLVVGTEKYEALGEIEEALAQYFDPSLCGAALISRQGETELIEAKPSERKEILQRIYDLDFKNQILSLDVYKKELEVKLKAIEDEILILKNQEYKVYDLLEESLSNEQIASMKKDVEKYLQENIALEKQIQDQSSFIEKVEALKKEQTEIQSEIKKAQEKKDQIQKENEAILASLSTEQIVDESKLVDLKKQLSELPTIKRIVEVVSNIEEIQDRLNEVQSRLSIANDKYLSMTQNKVCPTCSRPFDFKQEDIDAAKKLQETLIHEMDVVEEERQKEIAKKKEYDAKVKENTEIKSKKELLETKIESEVKSIEQQRKNIEIQKVSSQEKNVVNQERIEELTRSMLALTGKLLDIEQQIEKQSKQIIDTTSIQKQIDLNSDTASKMVVTIETAQEIMQKNEVYKKHNLEIKSKKLENEKKVLTKEKERDSVVKEIDLYTSSISILKKDFPNYVITQMISSLEEGINDFVSRVYGGRYKVYMEDTKTGIEMLYDECKAPIKEASGGEKQIFNIATKVAYSKIAGLGVLILDEVFSMLDYELAIQCFEALGSMIEDGTFNQIFVISHSEECKDHLILNYRARVIEVAEGIAKAIA